MFVVFQLHILRGNSRNSRFLKHKGLWCHFVPGKLHKSNTSLSFDICLSNPLWEQCLSFTLYRISAWFLSYVIYSGWKQEKAHQMVNSHKSFWLQSSIWLCRSKWKYFFLCVTKCSQTTRVHVIVFPEVILTGSSHSPIHSKKHIVVGTGCHSERMLILFVKVFFLTYTVCMVTS